MTEFPDPDADAPTAPDAPTGPDAPPCPQCGGPALRIVYGLITPDAFEDLHRDRQAPGGCVVMPDSPTWVCEECSHRWGAPEIPWWSERLGR